MHKQKRNATYVNLDGERISLRDAAKKYNKPLTTLRGRYNRGLRGPELLYGKGVYSYASR
ncbi:hypothetical protein KJB67_03625 [Staphylococcus haemolyticus]|uniref:hypothetical protein n=1 Tax=Staphylococcus haemolyticus TaxID=1283 RepID=UPI000D1E3438|nr:hypothetical protein [Staphylococcus haemolyticus]MCE4987187.1 hypothetical protein [Staphylococcus haemolyticus]MCE5049697.1 hypothetical protein [Staphylococcus haemolyticus]